MVALPLAAFTAVFLWGGPPLASGAAAGVVGTADRHAARFAICGGGPRIDCVVDGDTFWFHGEKIRVADINTPEVSAPQCAREAALGAQATGRLQALLNAGPFTLERVERDRDRYGRLLRTVTRGGESLGLVLVREGLAEVWRGSRSSWC
jgi:endonuclease YncB( thermonuclease family)